jgi:M6 family metalloprotease-like protein
VGSSSASAALVIKAGALGIRWIEDFSRPGSSILQYLLVDGSGQEVLLRSADPSIMAAVAREAFAARAATNRIVTIIGDQADDNTMDVQSLWRDYAVPSDVTLLAVTGAQPFVAIMCRFADSSSEPHPPSFYAPILDDMYGHLDDYWRAASNDVASLAGSGAASAWVALPRLRSYYITSETESGGNRYGDLIKDCATAADGLVHFPSYVGISMFFNESLGCCSVGGNHTITVDGQTRSYSYALMNPVHVNQAAVLAHEIGHTFGFPHSSGPYGQTYDSQWDVMSSPGGRCVDEDPSFECIPQHTIAFHKERAGWIAASRKFTAQNGSRATIALADAARQDVSGYLLAVVPIGTSTTQFYTIEVRRVVNDYDVNVPADAMVIHKVDTTKMDAGDLNASAAIVRDSDSDGDPNDDGAIWAAGEEFEDAVNHITISVTSIAESSATVVIKTYQQFTDDDLTSGSSVIRKVHITELRSRINDVCTACGLAPASFTDPSLTAGASMIRAIHISELRTALNAAYTACEKAVPSYTDPTLTAGSTLVKATHIAELRDAVVALE